MSGIVDAASIVSITGSAATCVALVFAGLQFRQSRALDTYRRQVEVDGVAVSWRPPEVPRTPEDASGQATWEYEFTAYNPGELPITDVRVEIHFALPVVRVRYDGHRDRPTKVLILESTPVLVGHGSRVWHRRLVMNYAESRSVLQQTKATISFAGPEDSQQRRTNYWPKQLWLTDAEDSEDMP
jgi:hypothetical protein